MGFKGSGFRISTELLNPTPSRSLETPEPRHLATPHLDLGQELPQPALKIAIACLASLCKQAVWTIKGPPVGMLGLLNGSFACPRSLRVYWHESVRVLECSRWPHRRADTLKPNSFTRVSGCVVLLHLDVGVQRIWKHCSDEVILKPHRIGLGGLGHTGKKRSCPGICICRPAKASGDSSFTTSRGILGLTECWLGHD